MSKEETLKKIDELTKELQLAQESLGLNPCPACGEYPRIEKKSGVWVIGCHLVTVYGDYGGTLEEAIETWNAHID